MSVFIILTCINSFTLILWSIMYYCYFKGVIKFTTREHILHSALLMLATAGHLIANLQSIMYLVGV